VVLRSGGSLGEVVLSVEAPRGIEATLSQARVDLAGGGVEVGLRVSTLYAIRDDGDRATLRWSFSAHDDIYTSPAVGGDGTIYTGSWDGNFYALNPENGAIKWVFEAGDVVSSPAVATDGTIYFAASENFYTWLYALNPDGTLKWFRRTKRLFVSDMAIDANGTIYVGMDDYLYAISSDNVLKWSYRFGESVEGPIIARMVPSMSRLTKPFTLSAPPLSRSQLSQTTRLSSQPVRVSQSPSSQPSSTSSA